jgi:porin
MNRRQAWIATATIGLLVLAATQRPVLGQQSFEDAPGVSEVPSSPETETPQGEEESLDEDLPFGAPDLLTAADQPAGGLLATAFPEVAGGLVQQGITFDFNLTQFFQGITHGGREEQFLYGGHGDYLFNFDLDKLASQQGLFLQMRAEHRFGESINRSTGALMPASILMDLPVLDDNELVLSELNATQFLSENVGVFFGKVVTIPGDPNAFASGRGREQFSNFAFVANPIPVLTVPYSTLAAGAFLTADPLFNQYIKFTIINPIDTTTTSGFDELFAEGVTLAAEARILTNFFCLPGHQLVGGTWSSREFTALGQDPRVLIPPLGIPIAAKSGSWSLFWNFDQYLVVDPSNPSRGWGVFGRAGLSDGNPNPLEWYLSFGLGGTSPLCGREQDSFGIGWYYIGLSDEIGPIANFLLQPRDETGVELYYKAAITNWFDVTADVQVIEPAVRRGASTAVLAGLRANLKF